MHTALGVAPQSLPSVSLGNLIGASSTHSTGITFGPSNIKMVSCARHAGLARRVGSYSFRSDRRRAFVGHQMAPSDGCGCRSRSASVGPWSRLFCSSPATTEPQQQHHQQLHQHPQDLNGSGARAFTSSEGREQPLAHSNPEIQVLLDRFSRLCEEPVPSAMTSSQKVFDRSDSRSPSRAVFSNNLVDLSRVEVVGFDYDYTLATCKNCNLPHHVSVETTYFSRHVDF